MPPKQSARIQARRERQNEAAEGNIHAGQAPRGRQYPRGGRANDRNQPPAGHQGVPAMEPQPEPEGSHHGENHLPQPEDEVHNEEEEVLPPPPMPPTLTEVMANQTVLLEALVQSTQGHRGQPQSKMTEFMRLRPLTFDSTDEDPLAADDWLRNIQKKLNIVAANDQEKVTLASH